MRTAPRRGAARKAASIILKVLFGLVLLIVLGLSGTLLWLRTDSAARFLTATLQDILREQGFTLAADSVSGPLPGHLHIRNLRFSDDSGLLFKADELSLDANLGALFRGRLEVERILVDAPELFRLPELAPVENPPEESGGVPVLPIDIVLDKLEIRQAIIHTAALPGAEASETRLSSETAAPAGVTRLPERLHIELTASAALRGSSLEAAAGASVKDEARQGIDLDLQLASSMKSLLGLQTADSGAPGDSLALSLRAGERGGGPVALLAGMPDMPGYSLALDGKGPVSDWRGALLLTLDPAQNASAPEAAPAVDHLLQYAAQLHLRCATGSFWRDVVAEPAFSFGLESRLSPGNRAPAPLATVLGEALRLAAKVQGSGKEYAVTAEARSPALELDLVDLSFRPRTGNDPQARKTDGAAVEGGSLLTASVQVKALDLNALTALGDLAAPSGKSAPSPRPPADAVSLRADVAALLAAGYSGFEARGGFSVTAQNEDFEAAFDLAAALEGSAVVLRQLRVQGLGVLLEASAQADMQRQDIQAEAALTAADNADWQHLAARLAGFADPSGGPPPLGGALRLDASLHLPPLPETSATEKDVSPAVRPPASGSLVLNASGMRWPAPDLAGMFGPSITLRAELSGGGGAPYALRLVDTQAGIFSASGQAVFTPQQGDSAAGLPAGALEAAFAAKISDLSPLAGKDSGVSGALEARISANGPLNALAAAVEVTSPSVGLPVGDLRGLSLKADAKTALADTLFTGGGAIALSVRQSPGGPLSCNSRWQASVPLGADQGKPLAAALQNFRLQGAGMSVSADLAAALSGGRRGASAPASESVSPPLALSGSLKASVQDWRRLAALTGAPLSGSPATLDITLASASGKQSARLNADLPLVRLRQPGAERSTFFLREVAASLAAADLFGSPDMDLNLRTGMGLAGPLFWNSGSGSVKGSKGKGAFALALRQERKHGPKAKDPKQAERLTLQGGYDLSKPEISLQTLALRHPRSGAGLVLKRLMSVSLENGVSVKDAAVDFLPSGSLTADAAFTPDALAVKLDLDALPFAFFKLFTPATLPDGALHAKADFSTAAQGRRGNFSVCVRASATQAVSGAALPESYANGAAADGSENSPAAASSGVVHAGTAAPVFEFLLHGDLNASPGQAAVANSGVRALPGVIWLRGNGTLGAAGAAESAKEGRVAFQLPLRAGANGIPLPDSASPFAAMLFWKGSVVPLWQAVPLPDRYLTGQALLDIKARGTLNSIRHDVSAYLAGCRFQDILNGILISGIDLEAKSTSASAVRAVIAANDGQSGSLALEADLTGLDGASPALRMRGQLDKFRPLHRDDLSISLSGILGLNGPLNALEVTSDIVVDRGEVLLSSQLGGSVTTLEVERKKREDETSAEETKVMEQESPATTAAGPRLNMRIRVPRYFYIRGMGLDSEWQGDLRISGSAAGPSLLGSLKPVRGYLDIFSRTFSFSGGDIEFSGGKTVNPSLNLELTYEGPDITAFIRAGGSAKKPKLTLDSRPPLPQDEVLARVLFGKRTSDLSRFEAIQLANSLRELTGFGGSGLDMLSNIRKTTGLDMLRIGGAQGGSQRTTSGRSGEGNLTGNGSDGSDPEAGAPTLEAGKYINESIYVGVEQGATTDSTAVRVEVELFPRVTLQGRSTSEASEVGIGWKMDY